MFPSISTTCNINSRRFQSLSAQLNEPVECVICFIIRHCHVTVRYISAAPSVIHSLNFTFAVAPRPNFVFRFPDNTQRHTKFGWTPLDEWSVRRRDLYLTTENTDNRQSSPQRDSNPQSQQASSYRPTPLTARPLGPEFIELTGLNYKEMKKHADTWRYEEVCQSEVGKEMYCISYIKHLIISTLVYNTIWQNDTELTYLGLKQL